MCEYVLVCVNMCWYVLSSLCCWLRQCWRRCVGCCVVVTIQKKNDICDIIFPIQLYINSKKSIKLQILQIYINSKNNSAPQQICNHYRSDGTSAVST